MAKGSKRDKAKARGPMNGPAHLHRGSRHNQSSHSMTIETLRKPFSLVDAARNTDRRHTSISATKLRNLSVDFVSAGTINNEFPPENLAGKTDKPDVESSDTDARQTDLVPPPLDFPVGNTLIPHLSVHESGLFFLDPKGKPAQSNTNFPHADVLPSPTTSESSEDIVVFAGRKGSRARSQATRNLRSYSNRSDVSEKSQSKDLWTSNFQKDLSSGLPEDPNVHYCIPEGTFPPSLEESPGNTVISRHQLAHNKKLTGSFEDEASIDDAHADYIANLREHDSLSIFSNQDHDEHRIPENRSIGLSESRIDKLEAPVSDEMLGEHKITGMGKGDPSWHDLPSDSGSESSLDTIGQATRDLEEALAEVDVEDDLFSVGMTVATDEQLARRLGKQEELGMNADTLMLLDGAEGSVEEPDLESLRREARRLAEQSSKSAKASTNKSRVPSVLRTYFSGPDEDIYGNFDIMDRERASIRGASRALLPRSNGSGGSDFDEALQYSWQQDRRKKKIKKQEREALRAQGLLNSKGKANMKAKYADGMTFENIKQEIKAFAESHADSIALPPMDKRNRKIVHDFANVLKIKSKSIGSGHKRFPCLYRTSRTIEFEDGFFDALSARLGYRFMPRSDNHKARTGGNGPGVSTAVSYRDGDIVGASAPKLGVENRGRAMLEKMGWCDGTALGAANNKGMLQPVVHVVKKSRAGLG